MLSRFNPFRSSAAPSTEPAPTPKRPSPPLDIGEAEAESEDELDDTIEKMNDAAGKPAQTNSPKKRKAPEAEEQPSPQAKRRSTERAVGATPAPVPAANGDTPASRLRSKKSVAPRPSFNRRDPFALQDDEAEEAVPNINNSEKPVHKAMRKLGKRTANPSPLKGRGVVEVVTADVDLLDSPEKRRRQPVVEVQRLPKDSSVQMNPVERVADPDQPVRKSPRKHMARRTGGAKLSKKRATRKAPNPAPQPTHDRGSDNDPSLQDTGDVDRNSVEGEAPELERTSAREAEIVPSTAPELQSQREETEQERQDKENEKKEKIAELMEGFETAASIHGFSRSWGEVLYNADKVLQMKSSVNPESTQGRRLSKRIKHLKNEFQHIDDIQAQRSASQPISLTKQIKELRRHVDKYQIVEEGEGSRELTRKARDLHQLIVPRLVFLAKKALDVRQDEGSLSFAGYHELSPLLAVCRKAAGVALSWNPRPTGMELGVKRAIVHIRADMGPIANQYTKRLQTIQQSIDDARSLDALEQAQERDRQRLEDFCFTRIQKLRELEKAREQHAQVHVSFSQGQPTYGTQQSQTKNMLASSPDLTMGGRSIDEPQAEQARTPREELDEYDEWQMSDMEDAPPVQSTTRPAVHRQATEEIPGPLQAMWPRAQREILISALQEYRKEHRFQKVVEQYGDQLGDRSLDDIVAQAKLIKASMARALETDLAQDASYDWLRSVPN